MPSWASISSKPRVDELAQAQRAGDAADQLAGAEAERLGRRRALAVRVALDLGDIVARVGRRIAVDRVVVEHAEDVRHGPRSSLRTGRTVKLLALFEGRAYARAADF